MKKSVYISGITCAVMLLLGCMFKIMHWPGASMLFIIPVALFCLYFLPSSLMASYQVQEEKKYKVLHIVTFIVFFISMAGVLFKVMHWPGASLLLFVGLPLPFVLFLPVYLKSTASDKKENNPSGKKSSLNFLGIMFGLTFLAVFSVLLSLSVSRQILDRAAFDASTSDQLSTFIRHTSTASNANGNSTALCDFIDELKCELLTENGNMECPGNKPGNDYDPLQVLNKVGNDYDPLQILNKDGIEITRHVLFGEGEKNRVKELKEKIAAYREALTASGKLSPGLRDLTNGLFDVSDKENWDENGNKVMYSWEQSQFPSYRLIFVIDRLSQIQANARLVESEFLASAR